MNSCLPFSTFLSFIKVEKPEEQLSKITTMAGEFPSDVIRQDVSFEAVLEFVHDRLGKGQGGFRLIQQREFHRSMRCYEQSESPAPAMPAKPASFRNAELLVAVDDQNGSDGEISCRQMNGDATLAVVQREQEERLALVFQFKQKRCQQCRLPRPVGTDDRPPPLGGAKAIGQGRDVQVGEEMERNRSRTNAASAKWILRSVGFKAAWTHGSTNSTSGMLPS